MASARSVEAVHERRVHAGDDPQNDRQNQTDDDEAEHAYDPGLVAPEAAAPPVIPGWADCRLSRARLAACASGVPGASSMTFCHDSVAPFRSCLPKALTIPTLSSVFTCLGSSASDLSNWASAL